MSFVDKFKDLVGIEEFDDDEITEEEIRAEASRMEKKDMQPRTSVDTRRSDSKESKVVNMQRGVTVNTHPFKMIVPSAGSLPAAP